MFCSKCGNELPEGAAFCGKCGARTGGGTSGMESVLSEAGSALSGMENIPSEAKKQSQDRKADAGKNQGSGADSGKEKP